jgi:hypothetical protein
MRNFELNWAEIRAADALADLARALLGQMLCAWHHGCTARADGTCEHPVLGSVAICSHCASADGVDLTPFPAIPIFS